MTSTPRHCTACGASNGGTARKFCTACGAPTPQATIKPVPVPPQRTPVRTQAPVQVPVPVPVPASAEQTPQPRYSNSVINTTRFLSALCMLSGILAVVRFDSSTPTGRMLIVPSVLISTCGQLFIHQAGKTEPPAWTGTARI